MAVNDIAVQEFVNAIKEPPQDTNKTYNATVSHIDEEGVVWVNIHGSDKETPTASTSTEVKRGDNVTVQWRNNKLYIGGNYSNPSAGFYSVQPSVDFISELVDKDITVNSINAATGYIGELTSEKITTGDIQASTGYIKDLKADNITAEDISASSGYIKELTADSVTAQDIKSATGYIADLTAEHITAENIIADHATIDDLDANFAHISNGVIDNATINHANVIDLNVDYAQANLANIDQAVINTEWVDTIMVQSGLISHDGAIFELDAIQVNASNITAGTIDVERLIVTVEGEKYLVHIDPTTGTPSYEKLDGDVIEDLTITADKIVAGAITADKITTQNIIGSGGWINLRNGTFAYADAGENNYLKWNGSKLQIKADEFILSTGQNILDAIEAIGTYFFAGIPTTENEPAVDWTTDNLKRQHLRDVYYDTDSGKSYRWSLSTEEALQDENGENLQDDDGFDLIGGFAEARYAWIQISDSDLDNISDRLSVAETQISQNRDAIELKASQADLDLATTRLTTAETTINQQAQAIALKAEASSVYSKLEIDGKFHEGLNIRTTFSDTAVTLTVTVVLAGVDVTDTYFNGDFEWFYRLPNGDVSVRGAGTSTYGKSITIQKSDMTYGQSIICVFTKRAEEALTDDNGDILLDQNDESLIGYVEVA